MPEMNQGALASNGPSAVGLTRLSTRLSFPPGREALYRSILRRLDLCESSEFVLVPCGRGRSAQFVAESTGAGGAGADPDPAMVSVASDRAKGADRSIRLHFEEAPLSDLPYQDDVFDVALAEIELGAVPDPEAAVRELARVTKPSGTVVLIQLVWARVPDAEHREELVERLGIRPRTPGEWQRMLRDTEFDELLVEDWSDASSEHGRGSVLGGLSELLTLGGSLRVLPRAWKRWGTRGIRAVLSRDGALAQLLKDDRMLGVTLIMATRARAAAPGRTAVHDR
jgi:SAM-dependent methyltransferase